MKCQCWEYMNCGREKNGFAEEELGVCPAYPDHGEECHKIVGTFCSDPDAADPGAKLRECEKCPYYQHLKKLGKLEFC